MTNNDIIRIFVNGSKKAAAANHIGFYDNRLFSYSTVICEIDRSKKSALFNSRKYSRTTSKHQSALRYSLEAAGYSIKEYNGPDAWAWNYGYQGAPSLTVADIRKLA